MDDLLKELIDKGREKGFLTLEEIINDLPATVGADPESLEFFVQMLEDNRIEIVR